MTEEFITNLLNFALKRELLLEAPASQFEIDRLMLRCKSGLDRRLIKSLRRFNGFPEFIFEVNSEICLWSISRVMANNCNPLPHATAIADFSNMSEIYYANLSDIDCGVTDEKGAVVAGSLSEFYLKVVLGNYGF